MATEESSLCFDRFAKDKISPCGRNDKKNGRNDKFSMRLLRRFTPRNDGRGVITFPLSVIAFPILSLRTTERREAISSVLSIVMWNTSPSLSADSVRHLDFSIPRNKDSEPCPDQSLS